MTNDAKKMVSNQKVETQKDVKNSSIKNGSILPPMATGDKANGGDSLSVSQLIQRLKVIDSEGYKKGKKTFCKALQNQVEGLTEDQSKAIVGAVRTVFTEESRPKAPYEVDPEPWHEDVQILDVIHDIENIVRRVMVMRPEYVTAVAYYCLASWFVDYLDYAPYMVITAPDRECGKSKLLSLMGKLVRRPYPMSGAPSDSSIFRVIEQNTPTLLMDEVDTYLSKSKELQGILNGGIDRENAFVTRSEGTSSADMKPVRFSTFGFKVLSGIGSEKSGEALVSRAIIVRLERKKASESRERVREISRKELADLRRKMYRLACTYGESLREKSRGARVPMPMSMGDRDCDKWEAQIILADMVSKDEGIRIRDVAERVSGDKGELSWKTALLVDAYEVVLLAGEENGYSVSDTGVTVRLGVDKAHGHYILTKDLNDALVLNREKRWGTFHRDRDPISQRLMTSTLKGFGVERVKIRAEGNRSALPVSGIVLAVETYAPNVEGD